MNRLVGWMALVALAALCVSLTPAMAQEDLEKQVGEKMQASVDATQSLHAKIAIDASFNGGPMPMPIPELGMEMWSKAGDYARATVAFPPMEACRTPEGAITYHQMSGKVLHVPAETLKQLQEQGGDAVEQALMSADPTAIFWALARTAGYKVTGDVTVEGQECWQLEVQPEALGEVVEIVSSLMPAMSAMGLEISGFAMGVQKDTAMVRKIDIKMTMGGAGGPEIGLSFTMKELEINGEIPDAVFKYQPPADATVIEWTPDRTRDEVMAEFLGGGMMGGAGN